MPNAWLENWHSFCMQERVLDAGECSRMKRILLLLFCFVACEIEVSSWVRFCQLVRSFVVVAMSALLLFACVNDGGVNN
jgi:hypothetical protein